MGVLRMGRLLGLLLAIAGLMVLAPASVYAVSGTGTLFIYSNNTCTALLPQVSGGNMGYRLPATGTTVYVKITGISELVAGSGIISLQYGGDKATLSTTISGTSPNESTGCTAWVVGTFDTGAGVVIACGTTGIVFYGQSSADFQTVSNGGADGGHFYGPGTSSSGVCATGAPEFPYGMAVLLAISIPILVLARKYQTVV